MMDYGLTKREKIFKISEYLEKAELVFILNRTVDESYIYMMSLIT